jgi:hypothetical protein
MAFYGTIPSVLDVFIQNHYKIFHEDLQIAKEKVKTFFEDLIYLEYINRVCMHGHNMQILADKIENIEHKYRNLLWQGGVALETRFDCRAVYQYLMLLNCVPKIRDEKDNLREKGVFEMYPTFNSDKYFSKKAFFLERYASVISKTNLSFCSVCPLKVASSGLNSFFSLK